MKNALSFGGVAGNMLNTLREIDVRPIRAAAENGFTLAIVSRDIALAEHLADLLYRGPRERDLPAKRVCAALTLDAARPIAAGMDVAVIVTREQNDNSAELELLRALTNAKVPTVVCLLQTADEAQQPPRLRQQWLPASVVELLTPLDDTAATQTLVKAIRAMKTIDDLALARHLPAFRESVARGLIEDVSNTNAAYSFGTGIFETNPVANLPLNAADMFVLTKNQAIMAYKIALATGMPAEFKDIMPKLAAVLGSGFAFRQIARSLVGLLPGLGLIPKVAVSFAGTYVAGEAIYRWCATGEKIDTSSLREGYEIALARGRAMARALFDRRKSNSRKELLPPPE
jgi:uncharacterized protein (DUF697 family)